jgi:hypothetical protein
MSSQTVALTIPEFFSPQERFLVEKTEEAIRDGIQLERWCRDPRRQVTEKLLDLKKVFALPNQAYGYFGSVKINDKLESVMGVRQVVDFGKISGADPQQRLRDFVLGEWLPRAHWVYPDGYPGGFTIEQSLYRNIRAEYGRFPEDQRKGCIDWRRLGAEYNWSLLTVYIHDFNMQFGPYLKRFKEAAAVVMHPDFIHVVEKPATSYKLEITVGYPFVAFAPIPNNYGFGPGKFGSAVKLYSFFLTDTNEIKVTMDFAAAPRCQKVFDFGKYIPDPVYGGASVLQALTFGIWKAQPFHDMLDLGMVSQHARVHQALMDGSAKVWNEWAGGASARHQV